MRFPYLVLRLQKVSSDWLTFDSAVVLLHSTDAVVNVEVIYIDAS